jgi:hypothetical protein
MPMYVQTVQAGTPTTEHLETYLNRCVAPDAQLQLQAAGQEIHAKLAGLPPPPAVDPAHLCATEAPVLVYQSNGMTVPAEALLRADPPPPPQAPVEPVKPVPPAAGCTADERAAYDAALLQYDTVLEPKYQADLAQYNADSARYQTMLATWTDLRQQVIAFNAALQSNSIPPPASGPSDSLKQIATDLQAVRDKGGAVKDVFAALIAIDARIVAYAKRATGDVDEASLAYAMALHRLMLAIFASLLERLSEAAEARDPAATFAF